MSYFEQKPNTVRELVKRFVTSTPIPSIRRQFGITCLVNYYETPSGEAANYFHQLILDSDPMYYDILTPCIMLGLPNKVSREECLEVWSRLFSSPSWQIRAFGIKNLGLGPNYGVERPPVSPALLRKIAHDENRVVRRELAETLCRLILHNPDSYNEMMRILRELSEDREWWVRTTSGICLGLPLAGDGDSWGSVLNKYRDDALAILERLTVDEDYGVRTGSLLASFMSEESVRNNFYKKFLTDKSPRVKGWVQHVQNLPLTNSLIYEFYAEMLCRNLEYFREEIEYDLVATDPDHPSELAELLIMPILKFNKKEALALLRRWETYEDPFFKAISSYALAKVPRETKL